MRIEADDVVYLIAVRARAPSKPLQEVLATLRPSLEAGDGDYAAHVIGKELSKFDGLDFEHLRALGFDFDAANEVMPVAVEHRPEGTE